MSTTLLDIKNLNVSINEKEILKDVNLKINKGETHILMGPNGAGKSTLGYAIMGNPKYEITNGSILFNGEDISKEDVNKRAIKGIFLSFQNPIEVPGITLSEFLRNALEKRTGKRIRFTDFKKEVDANMKLLEMDEKYLYRDLNVGFSGGEKKKAEVLQLLMLKPELAILDETDSGLDVDAVKIVSKGIEAYKKQVGGSLLIITHSKRILSSLDVDYSHVIVKGSVVANGDGSLVDEINENGFAKYENK